MLQLNHRLRTTTTDLVDPAHQGQVRSRIVGHHSSAWLLHGRYFCSWWSPVMGPAPTRSVTSHNRTALEKCTHVYDWAHFCLTSTEARWLINIRDGDRGGRVRKSDGSTADTARERPERPWTAARERPERPDTARERPERPWTAAKTMTSFEVFKAVFPRRCAATSALRNCCFSCRAGQSHKDNVRCTTVEEQPEAKEVQLSQSSSTSLLMISSGLTWGSSSTSLLLISWSRLEPCDDTQRKI